MITINGDQREWRGGTVRVLLDDLALDGRGVAVVIDGEIVHRRHWESTEIIDGCAVDVVTAMAGG